MLLVRSPAGLMSSRFHSLDVPHLLRNEDDVNKAKSIFSNVCFVGYVVVCVEGGAGFIVLSGRGLVHVHQWFPVYMGLASSAMRERGISFRVGAGETKQLPISFRRRSLVGGISGLWGAQ